MTDDDARPAAAAPDLRTAPAAFDVRTVPADAPPPRTSTRRTATTPGPAVFVAVGALLAATLTGCDAADRPTVPSPAPSVTASPGPAYDFGPQSILVELVELSRVPGAAALVTREGGMSWFGAAGRATLGSARPPRREDHFRIGELTETFLAVVILQLAAEGRLRLSDPVEAHLPGLLGGNGHDGRRITLLHLLVHTAGLHPYMEDPDSPYRAFDRRLAPADLVRLGLAHPTDSIRPGASYRHAHTHYVVLGMVIEKLTGRSYAAEVERRLIDPLKLTGTSFPGARRTLPAPHGSAYSGTPGGLTDRTELDPSGLGAGGQLISTLDDLNRFYSALLGGRVLPKPQLARMLDTSDGLGHEGVGLTPWEVSCKAPLYARSSIIAGTQVLTVAAEGGGHAVTLFVNADGDLALGPQDDILELEFCGRRSPGRPTEPS
ncbi:serine hydrolase [Streptomyces sp. YC504]|uniref:Serine hydrolase n=1 Tax=Streptomyces mesophilus TaxID=1775132 RepID=A0A6G4XF76_9ACTN|nr:serine hydrolase domain-containing protein [Streptomyces mesophilus]NGO75832.1 serine hydrolase [Streptomyces mesophilus]